MNTFDFKPLYRTSVGFDRLANLLAAATRLEQGNSYPPYNIRSEAENRYQITMAVAGFSDEDLSITYEQNTLTVTGEREQEDAETSEYLYRGIANRSFKRVFNLADHVQVTGAKLENGLLNIFLERELPEAMKPRKIEISSSQGRLLDADKAEKAA
ncbi:MAG: Hsp20 family protein [Gammaproteobacteria bacterium]|nr:Hsp20 family protein [Gammaproteobacteria bacterium]NNE04466.1 Hsp20 family protein [Xanthomonadales bacterium]